MLINFSNHPKKDWNDIQLGKARELYKSVDDLPFPAIDPTGDEDYIISLCNKYSEYIIDKIKRSSDEFNAVHIMGELTFTLAIVAKLQNLGVTCIASTTDRSSYVLDNRKISNFNFVRFREYIKNV